MELNSSPALRHLLFRRGIGGSPFSHLRHGLIQRRLAEELTWSQAG
jgi:hypothetical protein